MHNIMVSLNRIYFQIHLIGNIVILFHVILCNSLFSRLVIVEACSETLSKSIIAKTKLAKHVSVCFCQIN